PTAIYTLSLHDALPISQNHLWGTAEVVQQSLGTAGLVFLVIALMMGIFTGLNGFIMATSRLLFSMSRARILPAPFRKLHPKHQTDRKSTRLNSSHVSIS